MVQGVKLSKTQISNLDHDRRNRKDEGHPLCLGHRFYKVSHDVCLTMCLVKRCQSDLGVDHWTAVILSLR